MLPFSVHTSVFLLLCCILLPPPWIPCVLACQESCGNTLVPYPFRLSKCGRKDFLLHCNEETSQLQVRLNRLNFSVMFITSQALLIDPMQGACGKPNIKYFSFIGESSYAIPESNYFISRNNALMMYNCNENSSCGCDIRPEFDGVAELENYFDCPSQYCCGLIKEHSLLRLMKNCTSFVSWAINSDIMDVSHSQGLKIQVQYGLELEVWIPGRSCTCARNADCLYNDQGNAHTCRCKDGFSGDGFAMGLGCDANG